MKCPSCGFEYFYEEDGFNVCSSCQFKWEESEDENFVLDAHGSKLYDGDSIIVIKE